MVFGYPVKGRQVAKHASRCISPEGQLVNVRTARVLATLVCSPATQQPHWFPTPNQLASATQRVATPPCGMLRTCRAQHVLPRLLHRHLHHGVCLVQQTQALHQSRHVARAGRLHSHPHNGRALCGFEGAVGRVGGKW